MFHVQKTTVFESVFFCDRNFRFSNKSWAARFKRKEAMRVIWRPFMLVTAFNVENNCRGLTATLLAPKHPINIKIKIFCGDLQDPDGEIERQPG